MNCPTADKISQYIDQLLNEKEYSELNRHIAGCPSCAEIAVIFENEAEFMKETLQTPKLPDDFAEGIIGQLESYKPKRKYVPGKRMAAAAAGLLLAAGISTVPGFADWVGGLFSSSEVDDGLRMASQEGLATRVDIAATDKNTTFKIEDVVADTSRIALSFKVLDSNGKPLDTSLDMEETGNNVAAYDQDGKEIEGYGMGWSEGSEYGLIEFSLRDMNDLEKVLVKVDLKELNGKQGNWNIEVPVDLKERQKYTSRLALDQHSTTSNGVSINLKEVQFAPSSNELIYETAFTKEEKADVETRIKGLEEQFGKENAGRFSGFGTAIQYHIVNDKNEAVYKHNTFAEGQGHPSDVGSISGSGKDLDELGAMRWNESFIPQKDRSSYTLVLDGVIKTLPADFSIKIKPDDLRKKPVSFEYEGNHITIKKAKKKNDYSLRKSLLPIQKETYFEIEMEGGKEVPSADFGSWVMTDEKGNVYPLFHSVSILDEKDKNGRFKTTLDLKAYDLDKAPEELTLHLTSVTRYYKAEQEWKVPLFK
ncbi:DUF4179 domain-containing protein [Bacillus infantis]|uniref:DUF4179 domain-containing protein n=1 Tax=Bacillus infantis TaxID=324767 RepID=UPI003CEF8E80